MRCDVCQGACCKSVFCRLRGGQCLGCTKPFAGGTECLVALRLNRTPEQYGQIREVGDPLTVHGPDDVLRITLGLVQQQTGRIEGKLEQLRTELELG